MTKFHRGKNKAKATAAAREISDVESGDVEEFEERDLEELEAREAKK